MTACQADLSPAASTSGPGVTHCPGSAGDLATLAVMKRALISLAVCAATSQALACGTLSPALESSVQRSASTFGLDPSLLKALLWTESHFCPQAVSPVGARGLGQLMPATAAALGVNPHDPVQNIYGAAKYLRQMWDQFHDWTFAIAAYNAGPGAVRRYRGVPPYRETQNYVRKVLTAYPQLVLAASARSGGELPQATSTRTRAAAPTQVAVRPSAARVSTTTRVSVMVKVPAETPAPVIQTASTRTAQASPAPTLTREGLSGPAREAAAVTPQLRLIMFRASSRAAQATGLKVFGASVTDNSGW